MIIGLDIDGTITDCAKFFKHLSEQFGPENVYIITGRDPEDLEYTKAELDGHGIVYNKILHARDWHDKGRFCSMHEIDVLFEDQDEYIEHIPPTTMVFKPRNGGNYDFRGGFWLTKDNVFSR